MEKKLPYIITFLLLIVGLGVISYPFVSSWYNARKQHDAVVKYEDTVSNLDEEFIATELDKARVYNGALVGTGIEDPFVAGSGMIIPENYMEILNITDDGIMGYLEIPVINVDLPIYHGTDTDVLEKGVGHMNVTAFPIGGEGNHAVLTAHTGLPNAALFTYLTDVVVGDEFYVTVLKETYAYEVDQILVVEPSDTVALQPVAGEDYVTLVTCTPYAINSHRLLVRGHRIPYNKETETTEQESLKNYQNILLVALILLIILIVIIYRKRKGFSGIRK